MNFKLFHKYELVGNGIMSDGLFQINLQMDTPCALNVGLKQNLINENSSMLWHCRLGHISLERIKRLVNEEVLSTLDYTDFQTCIDCIKGK